MGLQTDIADITETDGPFAHYYDDDSAEYGSSDDSFTSAPSNIHDDEMMNLPSGNYTASSSLLGLPAEIIHHVLSYLDGRHLAVLMKTCRQLKALAENELLWFELLKKELPPEDCPSDSPFPSRTYRQLFITHYPYWFLPKYRIWISDEPLVGRMIICKFDPRRGCIEGYRVLAERGPAVGHHWRYKPSVLIHDFAPSVHLWRDDPVLNLPHGISDGTVGRLGWWSGEVQMSVGRLGHNTSASFLLAKNIPETNQSRNMELWPPRAIPNMPRVRAASGDRFRSSGHKPQKFDEISQTAFRIRHWSQFFTGFNHVGVRLGEEVSTWSTIDPSLYTPTKEKPYQGIFVGDYAGHGCEFLLVIQTRKAPPPPSRSTSEHMQATLRAMQEELTQGSTELDDIAQNVISRSSPAPPNLDDDIAHSGALEAIKLTGDPNVPRGEHTFIADDIGQGGLIRIAVEEPFRGARVVKSRGHVAARGFQNDEFIPSQLIMINPDRLAQYWETFGHISFYERVNLDDLLSGTRYRRASSGQ